MFTRSKIEERRVKRFFGREEAKKNKNDFFLCANVLAFELKAISL